MDEVDAMLEDSGNSPEEGERSLENHEDSLGEEQEEDRTHTS